MRKTIAAIMAAGLLVAAAPAASAAPSSQVLYKRYQCSEKHVAKRGVESYIIAVRSPWGIRIEHVSKDSPVLRSPSVRILEECAR